MTAIERPAYDVAISFGLPSKPEASRNGKSRLKRIHGWLRPGGLLLFSYEAGKLEDVTGQWLGVPMFFSIFDPETMKGLVLAAGFESVETEIESQLEQNHEIPYLWMLARRRLIGSLAVARSVIMIPEQRTSVRNRLMRYKMVAPTLRPSFQR